jgi:hypothetical protein
MFGAKSTYFAIDLTARIGASLKPSLCRNTTGLCLRDTKQVDSACWEIVTMKQIANIYSADHSQSWKERMILWARLSKELLDSESASEVGLTVRVAS